MLAVTLAAAGIGVRSPQRAVARATAAMALALAVALVAVLVTHRWATSPGDSTVQLMRWAAGFAAPLVIFLAVFFAQLPAFTRRWPTQREQ